MNHLFFSARALRLALMLMILSACTACSASADKHDTAVTKAASAPDTTLWQTDYVRIAPTDLRDNVFDLIAKQWMLVTAGNPQSFNTMTASWGAMGELWGRPTAIIFIRESRYTYEFLQREQTFTLSFFDEAYRQALTICGTRSGRASDKVSEAGLTPLSTPAGMMTFTQARMVLECRTMLQQPLDLDLLAAPYRDAVLQGCYSRDTAHHQVFFAEITAVYLRQE